MGSCRTIYIAAAACVLLFAQACAPLPSAGNFVDASVQLRSAITASGTAAAVELEAADEAARAKELRAAWTAPNVAADAMVAYAEAIAGIVKAGSEGAESARKVADATQTLIGTIGGVLTGVGAVGPALNLIEFAYKQASTAVAARSLEEALQRTQPTIDRVSETLGLQLDDLGALILNANKAAELKLRAQYADETGFLAQLRTERIGLYNATPPSANAARLLEIDRLEQAVIGRLGPMNREKDAMTVRLKTGLQLIAATRQGIIDWAGAHRQLLSAVTEGRAVDPVALVQSVLEMRELINKVRAQ